VASNVAQDGKLATAEDARATPGRVRRRSSEEMAELGIIQLGDPVLSTATEPFVLPEESREVTRIVKRLNSVADRVLQRHEFTTGAMGLAAPQLGENRSIAVFRPSGEDQVVLINPQIISIEPAEEIDWDEDTEGCLSYFDFRCWVARPRVVVVANRTLTGEKVITTFDKGRQARDVLHEIDHLNGVLCLDRMPRGARTVSAA
jgi:peptide deformylase